MPFYWPSRLAARSFFVFSLSLLVFPFSSVFAFFLFYWLVLSGWGLRTDRVLIALSQPCITNFLKL